MYESFFHLRERPFHMTPDPRYFFPSSKHMDALNHMVYTITERRGFVVITGEIGAGKTTLCHVLLRRLEAGTQVAIIRNTQVGPKDLILMTLEELEVPYRPGTKAKLIMQLNDYLVEQLAANRQVVLLIDEAQNLSPKALEEVRMFSNLETGQEKLLQLILMGQPELRQRLAVKELKQFRQRISIAYHLGPLDATETAEYVYHRLTVAGANGGQPIFNPQALRRVFDHSGGVPRLINTLCDGALLTGYVNEARTITPAIIDEVAHETPALDVSEFVGVHKERP